MIGAIVLAAGSSRRFGEDKRRALLPNGKFILQQTLETVLSCFTEVLVVLRQDDTEFEQALLKRFGSDQLRTLCATDSTLGMGHSLANAMTRVGHWDGVFVFLADMPHLKPATIKQLQNALKNSISSSQQQESDDPAPIVLPIFEASHGHPVGFSSAYFAEMALLDGDRGAKPIIIAHTDAVIEIAVMDAGVLQDVDTPGDL